MPRKHFMIVGLISVVLLGMILIGRAVIIGMPRRPMTEAQADTLVCRGLPANASISQVRTWLDTQHIEYGPHYGGAADREILAIIRDTGHPSLFITADIQLMFMFDKQHKLIGHSTHQILTGP